MGKRAVPVVNVEEPATAVRLRSKTAGSGKRPCLEAPPAVETQAPMEAMPKGQISAMLTALKYKADPEHDRKDKGKASKILSEYVGANDARKREILANFTKNGIKNLSWATTFTETKAQVDNNINESVTNFMTRSSKQIFRLGIWG